MPNRKKLSNFIEGLSRIVRPIMVQVEYEEPIDPNATCLNKLRKKKKIASFLTNNDIGNVVLRKFFNDSHREHKVDNITSIKAMIAPGTIRISNKKYIQNQACTVDAFNMTFDMMPLTKVKEEKGIQFIEIKEMTFKRFSEATSPRIPTQELEKKWNEKNKNNKEKSTFIKSFGIF